MTAAPHDMLMRLRGDHLAGRRGGLVSICSARREVLAAAFDLAAAERCAVVVEATANQVNPAGGYTGMSPEEFIAQAARLAQASGIGRESLLVGADHLGPAAWAREPARSAMARAAELARRCAAAGFGKLHLDTGFGCADDPPQGVPPQEAAARAALICRAAEDGAGALPPGSPRPLYVIGAEVPPPGGSLEAGAEAPVTSPAEIAEALRVTAEHFQAAGLAGAWERVAAIVVQPGVDFGDESVAVYRPERARELSSRHAALPGVMTYEVHSTDFQPPEALAALVRDHFTLLKVGPCLTFAFREAVFALAAIEGEWLGGRRGLKPSLIRPLLEQAMKRDPAHWERHYRGPRSRRRYLRGYSLRDRIRYYWARPEIAAALSRLMANLNAEPLPAGLIRQFFPESAEAVRRGEIPPRPEALVRRRIQMALRPYLEAGRAPGEGSRK